MITKVNAIDTKIRNVTVLVTTAALNTKPTAI